MVREGLAHLRIAFDFLENDLLADGCEWVLKTRTGEGPSLADINIVAPFSWIARTGSIPESMVSRQTHPRFFAYVDRFDEAVQTATSRLGDPTALNGPEAIAHITQAAFPFPDGEDEDPIVVDLNDPLVAAGAAGAVGGVKKGQMVASWPIDSGFGSMHRDVGQLAELDKQEVVLAVEGVEGRPGIRVHHPRWNYRVRALEESGSESEAKL